MALSRRQVLAAGLGLPLTALAGQAAAARPGGGGGGSSAVFGWSGHAWRRRSWPGGPGPCNWDPALPFVDGSGALTLRIVNAKGRWWCSEVKSEAALGFGTYEWTVRGPAHDLDANVVLGLFLYKDDDNEIDIELARWGDPANATNAQWAVQPADRDGNLERWSLPATGSATMRFTWTPGRADFSGDYLTSGGREPLPPWTNSAAPLQSAGVHVHMNLWLLLGRAPLNRLPASVAVTGFRHTPLQT